MSSHSSIRALSSSLSTSYQRTGSRLRSSSSRTSYARREPRAAISRMTPWPSASCHARRASSVRKMCSPNSGQRAIMSRSPSRSNTIVSVGSTATQALIVGSPVKAAMSPMNVRASASAIVDVLAGLAVDELDAPALDHVERRVADRRARTGRRRARSSCASPRSRQPLELAVGQPGEQHLVVEIREALAAHDLRGRHAHEATGPGPGPKREVGTRDSRGRRGSGAAACDVVMERATG